MSSDELTRKPAGMSRDSLFRGSTILANPECSRSIVRFHSPKVGPTARRTRRQYWRNVYNTFAQKLPASRGKSDELRNSRTQYRVLPKKWRIGRYLKKWRVDLEPKKVAIAFVARKIAILLTQFWSSIFGGYPKCWRRRRDNFFNFGDCAYLAR